MAEQDDEPAVADPDSEARRLALLPRSEPLGWDELMHHGAYQQALEQLP